MMETQAHQRLKEAALAFLRHAGCRAVAAEVCCPIARFRLDAAGYLDTAEDVTGVGSPRRCPPQTIVIECKQSREDFLRDSEQVQRLLALRGQLQQIRRSIEEHAIKRREPELRRSGTSLFAELEEWDFSASRLPGYRKVLAKLRRVDEKLHGETKFFYMARYRLADRLYLAAPRDMIRPRELPSGWGLLECSARSLDDPAYLNEPTGPALLSEAVPAPAHAASTVHRTRVLCNIAVAASRQVARLTALRSTAACA